MAMRAQKIAILLTSCLSLYAGMPAGIALAQTPPPVTASGDIRIENLGWDFVTFFDRTADLPIDQRVARFKQDVAGKFPDFYAPSKDDAKGQARFDQSIAESIDEFPAIRDRYIAKLKAFDAGLAQNMAKFKQTFPDLKAQHEIYLLHSLGQMDGGTRTLNAKPYLIFGADVMVTAHEGWKDEAAFFHHELFHVLHEPNLGRCEAMWCPLWIEGLATHAASTLNPGASEAELLLYFPAGMADLTRAKLAQSWNALLPVLDSQSEEVYSELFSTAPGTDGLPSRRGYYLGYLVAQELGSTHDLRQLARMKAAEVEPLVKQAVAKLAAQVN